MTVVEKTRVQQAELHKKLWAIANDLRGNMEASEFKNYILSLIFYKYLSEKIEKVANKMLKDDNLTYIDGWKDPEMQESLKEELMQAVGYIIEPQYMFSELINEIKKGDAGKFDIEMLQKAITKITESTVGFESNDDFMNLFNDMDLSSSRLGQSVKERTTLISKVINNLNDISFEHEDSEIDVLGDAYEYLISQFASSAGKKAGEFYTPQQVSRILSKIVTLGKTDLKNVYDLHADRVHCY